MQNKLPMAWAEGTVSGWVGGWALIPLGGCLLLCGLCRRKLLVSPRDLPRDLGPRYMSDPTAGTSIAASPRPPVGPRSMDSEHPQGRGVRWGAGWMENRRDAGLERTLRGHHRVQPRRRGRVRNPTAAPRTPQGRGPPSLSRVRSHPSSRALTAHDAHRCLSCLRGQNGPRPGSSPPNLPERPPSRLVSALSTQV
ncbi:uncharacterized protein LOC125637974 isoform X1 [Caretta caretta]|uniref:uncharacterized protein LOC125637974 isoform X1 n=1 Tax=Caretta caretta TaxID=8467 RepID=UPI003F4B17C3